MHLEKWFERKFPYTPPTNVFPALIERLRGGPVRVEESVGGYSASLWTRRDGDDWSIQEHVGHLGDLEELWFARLRDFEAGVEVLTAADLQNRRTHGAGHNDTSMEGLLGRFRRARGEMVAVLESMSNEESGKTALHPRLRQPMRIIDQCFFVAEHDDHHLAIMNSLGQKLG